MDRFELPPTQKGRHHELRARGIREFAGLRHDRERLDPFSLARAARLIVADFNEIKDLLSPETVEHLMGAGRNAWSGGAASQMLPSGHKLIILNPSHSRNRQNATLMEEICHVFLGHRPSRLNIRATNKDGKVIARDYNHSIEEEAYATGAAALVPYTELRRMVLAGAGSTDIARHYRVSRALVEYRIKISLLWDDYRRSGGNV